MEPGLFAKIRERSDRAYCQSHFFSDFPHDGILASLRTLDFSSRKAPLPGPAGNGSSMLQFSRTKDKQEFMVAIKNDGQDRSHIQVFGDGDMLKLRDCPDVVPRERYVIARFSVR